MLTDGYSQQGKDQNHIQNCQKLFDLTIQEGFYRKDEYCNTNANLGIISAQLF